MALSDRLAAMKSKQEAGDAAKNETMAREQAEREAAQAEKMKQEAEAKKSELAQEQERVRVELVAAEQSAKDAEAAFQEANAFEKAQGENLDTEAKAEIEAIKAEAGEAIAKLDTLRVELGRINGRIELLGHTEEAEAVSSFEEIKLTPEQQVEKQKAKILENLEGKKSENLLEALSAIESSVEIPAQWKEKLKEWFEQHYRNETGILGFNNEPRVYPGKDLQDGSITTMGRETMKQQYFLDSNSIYLPELPSIVDPEIKTQYEKIVNASKGTERNKMVEMMSSFFDMTQDLVSLPEYQSMKSAVIGIRNEMGSKNLKAYRDSSRQIENLEKAGSK